MAREPVRCPKCGNQNDASAKTCASCGIDLEWALEHWSQYVSGPEEGYPPLILISDDEPNTMTLIGMILERAGYRTARANSGGGQQTLELAGHLLPDLITTDFMKPGMRGDEMIARLRSNPVLRDIPVMMLSAGCMDDRIKAAMEAGATWYLCKPFLPHDLVSAVASILNDRPVVQFVHDEIPGGMYRTLGKKGYLVWAFRHRGDTVRWVRLVKPDVIAVAFHLSDGEGLDVLAKLKADPGVSDIPVVMLAKKPDPALQQRAMESGAYGVYTGPLDADKLPEVLRAALGEE
jgi:CheY-like chemotaxis protein